MGSSGTMPVRWSAAGAPTALTLPPGCTGGTGQAVSDGGITLGTATCNGLAKSVYWLANGTAVTLPNGFFARDYDDASGVFVGSMSPGDGTGHAAFFKPGSPIVYREDGNAGDSFAVDVASWGYVVGTLLKVLAVGDPGYQIATGWHGTAVFPLVSPAIRSAAVDVNDAGYALVQIEQPGYQRGVLVAPGGKLLGLENGGRSDDVVDLNNHGAVVGSRVDASGSTVFGLLYAGGGSVRLDALAAPADVTAYSFRQPVSINDSAWVVGNEEGPSQHFTAWLLRPPSS